MEAKSIPTAPPERAPKVEVTLEAGCVRARVEIALYGDGEDWDQMLADAFWSELYSRCRTTALLHREYGLQTPASFPAPAVAKEPRLLAPEQGAMPLLTVVERPELGAVEVTTADAEESAPTLDQRIEAAERAGLVLRSKKRDVPTDARVRRECHLIWQALKEHGGELRPADLAPLLPEPMPRMARYVLSNRLQILARKGRVTARKTRGFQNPTLYRAVDSDDPEGEVPRHPLMEVLPWTRGKTFLMMGGQPGLSSKREKIKEIEATLQLAELRWPEFDHMAKAPEKIREVRKGGIDLLIVTRWNRTHVTDIAHEADRLGIPVLRLTRGCNLTMIVEHLRQDLPKIQARAPSRESIAA